MVVRFKFLNIGLRFKEIKFSFFILFESTGLSCRKTTGRWISIIILTAEKAEDQRRNMKISCGTSSRGSFSMRFLCAPWFSHKSWSYFPYLLVMFSLVRPVEKEPSCVMLIIQF